MNTKNILLLALVLPLAACQSAWKMTSIDGGESKVFEAPPYEVKGKTVYDQNWIDSQVEGGVAAFNWPRPAPRPPEIDNLPAPREVVAPVKPKKKSLLKRIKAKILPKPRPTQASAPAPFAPQPTNPTPLRAFPVSPPIVADPVKPPRDAVDELLYPDN